MLGLKDKNNLLTSKKTFQVIEDMAPEGQK